MQNQWGLLYVAVFGCICWPETTGGNQNPLTLTLAKTRECIGSVANRSVEAGKSVTGNFAIAHNKFLRILKYASRDIVDNNYY